MTHEATLLLDVGGQSCRALVIDQHGQVLDQISQPVATTEGEHRVEQDADALAEAVGNVARQAISKLSQSKASIGQAALATQRGSVVCWDRRDGAALSPVISWRDRRGLPDMQALSAQADAIKQRSGLRFSPYGGASKLAWCMKNQPEVARAHMAGHLAFGPLGSFLVARLRRDSKMQVDDTLAQRTLLWSRQSCDWDPWLLEQFKLPRESLPAVQASRSDYGPLVALNGSPPLGALMGDQNAVPFIDGTPDPATLYVNLGTGAFVLRPVNQAIETELFQLSILERAGNARFALEGSIHGAASAIEWLARDEQTELDHERFEGLRQRVGQPPLFINTVDGLGSPWWQPGPEPGFVDESGGGNSSLDSRLLAVLESIAFLIRANVEAMSRLVPAPRRIVLSGGLSRSDTLCQLIADLLGTRLQRLIGTEGTALGLWCHLHQRALPDEHFETVEPESSSALEQRYLAWLKIINQP